MRLHAAVALALVISACTGSEVTPSTLTGAPTTNAAPSTSTTSVAVATTEVPTSTLSIEPLSPGDLGGTVGYVGCSMSQNAVEGYEALSGGDMWSRRAPYGGGGIGRWAGALTADRGRYWDGFDAQLAANPDTSMVWLNLCTLRQSQADSLDSAAAVIEEIVTRIPGAIIYVSAQPGYTDGHSCGLAGEGGPELMADVTQEVIDAGLALPGPVMGPLAETQTRDGCHANEDGQRVLGQQLLDFFG